MARRPDRPRAPRETVPDLPPFLETVHGLGPRTEVIGSAVVGLSGVVEAAHARVVESALDDVVLDRLDVTGATLTDVRVGAVRVVEVRAPAASWRSVEISGGRISTLDVQRGDWDGVLVRGARIDYLGAAAATLRDVAFVDCDFGTLDLPGATCERVAFAGCRADEVDTRDLRATDLDLRGLEALSFTDVRALRGATLTAAQLTFHAPSFAAALGVDVRG